MRIRHNKIAMMLALVLMLTLVVGCGSGDKAGGDKDALAGAGAYSIVSMSIDGEEHNAVELGLEYLVILNEDGSAEIYTDDIIEGTWGNGVITYKQDGEEYKNSYSLSGDTLTLNAQDGDSKIVMVLERIDDADMGGDIFDDNDYDEDYDEDNDEDRATVPFPELN